MASATEYYPDRAGTAVKVGSDEWHRRQGILQRYAGLFDLNRNGLVEFQEVQQALVLVARRRHEDCAQSLYMEWREEVKEDGGPEACLGGCMDNMDPHVFCETFQELTKDFTDDDFDDAMAACDSILHELHRLTHSTERGRVLWQLFRRWDFNYNGVIKMNELEAVVDASRERYELDETDLSRVQPGLTFPEFYDFFLRYICESSVDDAFFYKMVGHCIERIDQIWGYIRRNDSKQGYTKRDIRLNSKEGGGTLRDPTTTRQELSAPAPTKRAVASPMKLGVQSPRRSGAPRKGDYSTPTSPELSESMLTPLQKQMALQVAQYSPRSPASGSPRMELAKQKQLSRMSPTAARYNANNSIATTTIDPSMLSLDDIAVKAAEASGPPVVFSPGRIRPSPRMKTSQQVAAERLLEMQPDPWNSQSPRSPRKSPTRSSPTSNITTVVNSTMDTSATDDGPHSPNMSATYQSPTIRRWGVVQNSDNVPADEADLFEQTLERSWGSTRRNNARTNHKSLHTHGWGWRRDMGGDYQYVERRSPQKAVSPRQPRYDAEVSSSRRPITNYERSQMHSPL